MTHILAAAFFIVSFFFVYKSFYGMRIKSSLERNAAARGEEIGRV